MRALGILGLIVGVALLIFGILLIPTSGFLGVAWTLGVLLILVINARRFPRRGWSLEDRPMASRAVGVQRTDDDADTYATVLYGTRSGPT